MNLQHLQRKAAQWWDSWLVCGDVSKEWRQELKRNREYSMLVTSYVFAPVFWVIALVVVTYYTIHDKEAHVTSRTYRN